MTAPKPSILRVLVALALALLAIALPTGPAAAATVPSAPTNVVAVAGDASARLTWSVPTSDGGRSITGYRVRYSSNGGTSWSSSISTGSTAAQYTVGNLRNGRTYVFQVRAVNRIGSGAWSAASAPVTPTATPPPPPPPPPPTSTQRIAVPSYFYPGDTWTQLESGAPTVGLAVINPNSGPGSSAEPNYVTQAARTKAKGISVIGYVHTSYTTRSLATVKAEVDQHYAWYGVDGIFFDEVTNTCSAAEVAYYADLFSYVETTYGTKAIVVLNPGTRTGECYMGVSDVVVTFESSYAVYATMAWATDWEARYDPSRFWHLVVDTSSSQLPSAIALSRSRNAGWVYVTPDGGENPWDTLPPSSYWSSELTLVRS